MEQPHLVRSPGSFEDLVALLADVEGTKDPCCPTVAFSSTPVTVMSKVVSNRHRASSCDETTNWFVSAFHPQEMSQAHDTTNTPYRRDLAVIAPRNSTANTSCGDLTVVSEEESTCAAVAAPSSASIITMGSADIPTDRPPKKKPRHSDLRESVRAERNGRERERSRRLVRQFADLRSLLCQSGVIIPRETRGAILDASMEYIQRLQEAQRQAESTNQMLKQQLETLQSGGTTGDQYYPSTESASPLTPPTELGANPGAKRKIGDMIDYSLVFEGAPAGMAIASLGGQIVECNATFCHLTQRSKEDLQAPSCSIFTLIAREDLPCAFDRINAILSPDSRNGCSGEPNVVDVRGNFGQDSDQNDEQVRLRVSLLRGPDGRPQHWAITLLRLSSTASIADCGKVAAALAEDTTSWATATQPTWIAPDQPMPNDGSSGTTLCFTVG